MGFADGIHIKSAGMQLWAAAFARLMTCAEAVDPSCLALLSSSPLYSDVEDERRRKSKREKGRSS